MWSDEAEESGSDIVSPSLWLERQDCFGGKVHRLAMTRLERQDCFGGKVRRLAMTWLEGQDCFGGRVRRLAMTALEKAHLG
jgi:hypothetical protein